jgi:hypothetical protein
LFYYPSLCYLSKNIDGSVKRFRFGGVIEKKKGYMGLYDPIEWLEKTKLISKCYPIDAEPTSPLSAYKSASSQFKIFISNRVHASIKSFVVYEGGVNQTTIM